MAIQAIRITNRDDRDARVSLHIALPAIAYRIARLHLLNLQDRRLQGADILQPSLARGTNPIQTDTQAHHIHLIIGKTFDTRRIEDMLNDLVLQALL